MKNYYKILGVSSSDNIDTIKKAYKKRARETHPDLHPGNAEKENQFKETAEAWETLGDSAKRKKYDLELTGANKRHAASNQKKKTAPVGRVDFEEMMKNFGGVFSEDELKQDTSDNGKSKVAFDSEKMFKDFMGFK